MRADHSLRSVAAPAGAKLCHNMVLAVQQIAVGEAFVLAENWDCPRSHCST